MGEVFLARASRAPDGSHVVIKTLHPELADRTEVLSMFAHEAQLGVQLSHPNIARVEEVGRDGEAPYLVMEWVPGPSLSEIISRFGRLPYAVVLRIVGDVAAALDHAHTAIGERGEPLNVVHRDVSPQNILVSVDGRVKLIDFGVARSEGQSHETETGVLKGKLSYMAPEQFRGRADHRVDLFSLGIVLHEALEGQRLFRRSTQAEVTAAILFEDIPPLTGPSIVRSTLQPIVDRALARNPDERYSSAAALRADVVVAMEQLGLECEDPDLAAIVQQAARARARDATPP
jgi:serine/threonine-protein kinase